MTFRPARAFLFITLISLFLFSACQGPIDQPEIDNQLTQTAMAVKPTATPRQNTAVPTRTPTPIPTPTLPPHLDLSSADINGTVIEFWYPWQGEMADAVEALAAEFSRTNQWGISVQARAYFNDSSLLEAVNRRLELGDGSGPQVVAAPADQLAAWSEAGDAVVDLSEYARHLEYGFTQKEIASFNPVFWDQDFVNGRQLGIPALRNAQVLFYNQTWAKELGFQSPPANAAEFKRQACAAAVENNASRTRSRNGTGGWLVGTDALTLLSWLSAFDAEVIPARSGEPYQFATEESGEALTFLRGMMDDGCAWVSRGSVPYGYFSDRMALFYSGSLSDLFVQKNQNASINNADEWIIIPFPGKQGQKIVYASGPSFAVMQSTPQQQMAAWLFIRWMAQPRNLSRLAELLPSIPVSSGVETQVADYRANFPWSKILPVSEQVIAAPAQATWRVIRRLLADAAWQVYYLPKEQLVNILPQLEAFAEELLPEAP